MKMREIVSSPGGEKLSESDRAEIGLATATVEVTGLQIHGAELGKAFATNGGKLIVCA